METISAESAFKVGLTASTFQMLERAGVHIPTNAHPDDADLDKLGKSLLQEALNRAANTVH